jgi:hypothetical protein
VRLAVFTCLTVLVPYALCASSVRVVASSCLFDDTYALYGVLLSGDVGDAA